MKILLFALVILGLSAFSCEHDHHHDDGPYLVSIDIQSPAEGSVAALGQPLPVKVVFSREEDKTIHNVYIHVFDEFDNLVTTLIEQHVHVDGEYVFESSAFTPSWAGAYKIQVLTRDDAEESPNLKEVSFSVQ